MIAEVNTRGTLPELWATLRPHLDRVRVDEPLENYTGNVLGMLLFLQRWRGRQRNWGPTPEERRRFIDAGIEYCALTMHDPQDPEAKDVRDYIVHSVRASIGPLTWLWIAVMVAKLVAAVLEWRRHK